MKRRISICAAITVVVLTAALWSYNRSEEPEETQMAFVPEESEEPEETVVVNTGNTAVFLYVLRDCDGRVAVYEQESGKLYMETGIRTADLPEYVQSRLTEGIGFADEQSLFDFLESYSS